MRRGIYAMAMVATLASSAAVAQDKDRQGDVNVQARAGVGGFTGSLDDYTSAGPAWGVAVNLQPYRMLGVEIGYEGSRNQLSDDRLPVNPNMTRHGASAMVKLAPPFIERVKPFVAMGLGASYVSVQGGESGMYSNDFIEEVPVAAGLEFNTGAMTAGLRATYRFLIDESFADAAQPVGNPEGGLFDTSFTLGLRF